MFGSKKRAVRARIAQAGLPDGIARFVTDVVRRTTSAMKRETSAGSAACAMRARTARFFDPNMEWSFRR